MRHKFCCDASKHLYETYYTQQQSGSGIPIFSGSRNQKGHGLGSLLGGLFRKALPMIKKGLATFGKHALKTGLEIANDVVAGDTLKNSAKRRVPEGIKRFATRENFINQSGTGSGPLRKRRRKTIRNKSTTKLHRKKKTKKRRNNNNKRKKYKDIFA